MIVLYNPTLQPFNIQYVNGQQSYRKEIMPLTLTAFQHLTTISQITNLAFLQNAGMTIYDQTANTYQNVGVGGYAPWSTGYTGWITQSGITFNTGLMTNSSGYTFIVSASTSSIMANNTCTASTVGLNTITAAYSGSSCSTNTFIAALNTTAFSGMSISVAGGSNSTYLFSGASVSFVLSSATISTAAAFTPSVNGYPNKDGFAYVMLDNTQIWNQPTILCLSSTTCYTAMSALI